MNASETTANPAEAAKPVRCATYARVSVADASASELTSIDVQVEACQSFIGSQQALGWVAIEPSYADQGYSGSNLNRPALQALLADMAERKVDVVVVHRLDRSSRSIGDLCALVSFFEGASLLSTHTIRNRASKCRAFVWSRSFNRSIRPPPWAGPSTC